MGVQVLIEAQRLAYEIGLPRLSPASALLEVFFDGLYRARVIEEQYFGMWSLSEDDTPGKINASFQLQPFLDFLRVHPLMASLTLRVWTTSLLTRTVKAKRR